MDARVRAVRIFVGLAALTGKPRRTISICAGGSGPEEQELLGRWLYVQQHFLCSWKVSSKKAEYANGFIIFENFNIDFLFPAKPETAPGRRESSVQPGAAGTGAAKNEMNGL